MLLYLSNNNNFYYHSHVIRILVVIDNLNFMETK
ncbi:hypothetical protein BDD30_2522 [Photorhabdus asymbiotica]|uniref:Uncharacterized protein n=1 Tax=Photorhabdus asymbiotica TaxID=291112 RepID=A0ABX9SJL7_9GAMM|nr:hypothetical protein BDD30_2522 [Photorhabdus asymbiotica]